MMVFLFGFAMVLVYLGFNGWVVNKVIPAQYIGFLVLACWLAGLCGLNIWYGGPFDPRHDHPSISDGTE